MRATVERVLKNRPPEPAVAAQAYAAVRPSLVFIEASGPLPLGAGDPAAGEFAVGTGLIVEEGGTILTSLHVVQGAEEIRVRFADGFQTTAEIAVVHPENDLAVLRPAVVPEDLMPATLAGSGHLQLGDEVVAVGSPFGIPDSVSAGVVSGLGRAFVSPARASRCAT